MFKASLNEGISCFLCKKKLINLKTEVANSVLGRLREIGLPLARKISLEVQKLVNISASAWVFDSSFEIFLVVMLLNDSKILKR